MKFNIYTQSTETPMQIDGTYPPTDEQLRAHGQRELPDRPPIKPGYTRVSCIAVELNGVCGQWQVIDRLTSEIEAEAAKAEATRRATPIVYDQPIEVPFVTVLSQTGSKGIGITATDDGQLVPFEVHASPWPDKSTLDAKIKTAVDKKNAIHAAGKAGVNGQLQQRIENIERFLGWRP